MGRKRKVADGGKLANKGKIPALDKTKNEEKEQYETARTVLESKDVENDTPSPSNNLPCGQASHIEHVVESENLVEKEKEEPKLSQQVGTVPLIDKNMELKVFRTTNADSSSDLSYKSMYISSQITIERLMAENCRLSMQLEFAHGKIEAYETVTHAIRTAKDVILIDSKQSIMADDSAPVAHNHDASPEKNESKNASKIANERRVTRQRKKNC